MRQAKLTAPEQLTYEEVDVPTPGSDEVTIQVKACGICGSDIHTFKGEHPFVHPPIVLGHEFSGVVEETGIEVQDLHLGDRVTVEPNMPCGSCYNCRHGNYNICQNLQVIGNVGYDGAFAEYISVPESRVVPLPDELSFEEGALIEPTAVGVHAVRIGRQKIGDKVVVLGAGTIGLLTLGAAVNSGAKETIVTDLSDYRLNLARKFGANLTWNSNQEEDLGGVIQSRFGPGKADLIYDCVGVESTVDQAVSSARKGSQILLVGVPKGKLNINLAFVQDKELELKGSLMYVRKDFLEAIKLIEQNKIDVEELITHRFPFQDLARAFDLAVNETKLGEKLKIIVRF